MPDDPKGAEGQPPADGGAAKPSAVVPQGEATPAPDPLAALTARLDKYEAMAKDLHAERTAHGRTKAMLKIAAGENADKLVLAFTSFEREKKSLLEQGYSERVINALAESDPEALLELAQNAPRPTGGSTEPTDEIKALRAEIETLKAGKAGGAAGEPLVTGGGTVPTGLGNYGERLRSDKPMPSVAEIDQMTAKYLK